MPTRQAAVKPGAMIEVENPSTITQVSGPALIERPPIHVLGYGESGARKTSFAASFPTPGIVFMFDPLGKEMPYLRRGRLEMGEDGYTKYVLHRETGELLWQVEQYSDTIPEEPWAYEAFRERLVSFHNEYDQWKTVVIDSLTFLELMARWDDQFRLNKNARDPRQWYAHAKEAMEQLLFGRLTRMPMNVVVLAHIDEEKDEAHGMMVRNPAVVGKLRKFVGAGFAEFYHVFLDVDETGERTARLQTQSDRQFNAASMINAPNGCEAAYEALWVNYDEENAA